MTNLIFYTYKFEVLFICVWTLFCDTYLLTSVLLLCC